MESLKARKNEIMDIVYREEAERVVLEKNLKALEEKLNSLNQSLDLHRQMYDSYDKTIQETESGFKKVMKCFLTSDMTLMYYISDSGKQSSPFTFGPT